MFGAYPINLKIKMAEKLIRIITCSPYRTHSKPLLVANNVLSANGINVYIVSISLYNYCNDNVLDILDGFFGRNSGFHNTNTRQSDDFHIQFARLDVSKCSLRIHWATIWNDVHLYIKPARSLTVSKQMPRKLLIDMNVHAFVTDVTDYWMTVLLFSEEYDMQETSFSCEIHG